jgi:glycosyltransferase involved in cell wall biosynthesis
MYKTAAWATAVTALTRHYLPVQTAPELLPINISVSIVIATRDRPNDLRECLRALITQISSRRIEIVVVDNNPASGLTPPVVGEFPGVLLVKEPRQGLAYARNAGFVASTGDILIATDDDVLTPPDWVERLVAPFVHPEVMIVTGNVLPFELDTPSQQFYESYGGLGRGFQRAKFSSDWFEWFRFKAVPTWRLGATANAAFRASIFAHPEIGLMDETLGPGMPSGVGEDTYVFYKVLKAGYTIAYEPEAYVWHKHRRTMDALRRQLYSYSKGGVAYNLTTFLKDGDWRGLFRIFIELPLTYMWRINQWLHRRIDYPISLLLLEMKGNLAGFWGLWQSWQRVKREGRSTRYIPPSQRAPFSTRVASSQAVSLQTLVSESESRIDD